MQSPVYAGYEAIEDDVHAVRKRETSRLWYRDRVVLPPVTTAPGFSRSFLQDPASGRTARAASTVVLASSQRRLA